MGTVPIRKVGLTFFGSSKFMERGDGCCRGKTMESELVCYSISSVLEMRSIGVV